MPSATHLKIDVDGAELRVLKGAKRLLANRRLRSVLLEVNWTDEGSADEVLNLMSKAGFAETERGRVWKCGAMSWQNVIFFRN